MKNWEKGLAITGVAVIAVPVCALLLVANGVISLNPPHLQTLADAGIPRYRSFAEGWEDSTEKYAFQATTEQVRMIVQRESLSKTTLFDCEEPTARNRLQSIVRKRPYWFAMPWARGLEHYAAEPGPPIWKEMVFNPVTGECRVKIWTD